MEGTQAEADALIEESSYWIINTNDDEGHEERAWGALILHISQSTFAEVAAALGRPFSSWAKTKVVLLCWMWTMLCLHPLLGSNTDSANSFDSKHATATPLTQMTNCLYTILICSTRLLLCMCACLTLCLLPAKALSWLAELLSCG